MRKTRPIINFEKSLLHKLASDENSCVEVQEQKYHLALHPYHLTNVGNSIKDLLGRSIAKYDKKLQGILLGYENIKLLSEGTIVDDSFFVHIDISANFYLFKPEVDKVLVGIVNKKSEDHVGCLVFETFNVSIPKPEGEDVNSWAGSSIEIGEEISFKITFLKLESRLPYIRGQLMGDSTETQITTDKTLKKKKKKRKHASTKHKTSEETFEDDTLEEVSPKKAKKAHHNEVHQEYLQGQVIEEYDENETGTFKQAQEIKPHKSKKKKKHKDVSFNNESFEGDQIDTSQINSSYINGEEEHKVHKKRKKRKHHIIEEESTHNTEFLDEVPQKKKKKKHNESFEGDQIDTSQINSSYINGEEHKVHKKRKKRKHHIIEEESTHNTEFLDEVPQKKKKHKSI